jgi:Polyprenyl synthetase
MISVVVLAGISDVSMYAKAREILLIMGEYFQIQDDYLGESVIKSVTCRLISHYSVISQSVKQSVRVFHVHLW